MKLSRATTTTTVGSTMAMVVCHDLLFTAKIKIPYSMKHFID
jgi:hypothetical protein